MSAFESLYSGQFTLSTQLMKPNYLVIPPTNAATQFLYKLTPLLSWLPHTKCKNVCQINNNFFFADRRDLVRVEATVLEKTKGPKKIVFKMKRRKGYRKWKGMYTMCTFRKYPYMYLPTPLEIFVKLHTFL